VARIRSIHPRLFVDDAFMDASMEARVLMIGIWTLAFDDGVFEWKPKSIKASIFPGDNINIASLLSELTRLNFIKEFSVSDRHYGAVRNFCKFQRPKKPNRSNLLPSELRAYVALDATSSEPVGNHGATGSENDPQKGGREEGIYPSEVVETRSLGEVIPHPHARGQA
jgi:hypothetical protein